MDSFFENKGWAISGKLEMPGREAKYLGYDSLNITEQSKKYLQAAFPEGIYLHQLKAINAYLAGNNVCLTTGTASGKSMVFYLMGIEEIVKNPSARILAIYPLRALGKEQESRWERAFKYAGMNATVGRIDGQVSISMRSEIIKRSQVIIATPDVIHAWLMSNLSNRQVMQFISSLSLIVIDEIHNYTGVFGSNAAFLFRRLQLALNMVGKSYSFVCASATISKPEDHLFKLLGKEFKIIDESLNTSPKESLTLKLVNPPQNKDLLTNINELLTMIGNEQINFITFVDSRKQAEYVSAIAARSQQKDTEEEDLNYAHLRKFNILPFRSGYEEADREIIQDRLSQGELKGVVSTSALELGIDIPYLNLGILIGVPRSGTSFFQRIGRIGRNKKGEIIIVNRGNLYDENIFRDPKRLLKLPLTEGALYLENPRIQYIHALSLARQEGEYHQICEQLNVADNADFGAGVNWPKGFVEMCKNERLGLVPIELQSMKEQGGNDPNHAYPLRDVDSQFKVEHKSGPDRRSLGSLSYGQLMREAYPGAVYYYTSRPFRIFKVHVQQREVEARCEKKYTTIPITLPIQVYPNLGEGNIYQGLRYGDLVLIECSLQIREAITGYKERRGPNETAFNYPLDRSTNIYFDQPRFARNYFTTGVIISHPILRGQNIHIQTLAQILYEAFLMVIPFERSDINYAWDKFKVSSASVKEGDRFTSIYDQTYGSLRLSGRFLEPDVLDKTFKHVKEIISQGIIQEIDEHTLNGFEVLYEDLMRPACEITKDVLTGTMLGEEGKVRVIMPKSKGLNAQRDNEEFEIEAVFYSPDIKGLAYRGKHLSEQNDRHKEVQIIVPINSIVEIPGESKIGFYNLKTGELRPKK